MANVLWVTDRFVIVISLIRSPSTRAFAANRYFGSCHPERSLSQLREAQSKDLLLFVSPSRRRLIDQIDASVAEGPALHWFHGQLLLVVLLTDALEHRSPPAKLHGIHHDRVLVDQPLIRQLRNKRAASENRHAVAGLLLHLPHLRRHLALHQLRIAPRDIVQRR